MSASAMKKMDAGFSNTSLKKLLTTRQVADLLQISPPRLYTLCACHEFPHIKVSSRRLRFDPCMIKKWLDSKSYGRGY